jgi:hypothetical protein
LQRRTDNGRSAKPGPAGTIREVSQTPAARQAMSAGHGG